MRLHSLAIVVAVFAFTSNATADSIEIILDASGSMNAPLDSSMSRIAAARSALESVVSSLPANATVAFRAYGHGSPREKHDCDDTALLVPFSPANAAGAKIVAASKTIKVQGYTPISRVLRLAVKDLSTTPAGRRTVILISDGRETCDADPCATAAELRKTNADIVVHTVGLGVDLAARSELQCIATATGGTYFDAKSLAELTAGLAGAVKTPPKIPPPLTSGLGKLKIDRVAMLNRFAVIDANGKEIAGVTPAQTTADLPAGTYTVMFGKRPWRGVVIKSNETTVIKPAVLHVDRLPTLSRAVAIDPETREQVASVDSVSSRTAILPGTYTVRIGGAEWPNVRMDSGQTVTLKPARLKIEKIEGSVTILDASGQRVGSVDRVNSTIALPPGTYGIKFGTTMERLDLKAGEDRTFAVPR